MSTYSILVTNNAPGCGTEIEQQLTVTGCTTYIVRLASNSNALGIKGLVRKLNDDISIRNGKYGDYIFYKTPTMKNPTFLKLKGFSGDYKSGSLNDIMEWIKTTYKI